MSAAASTPTMPSKLRLDPKSRAIVLLAGAACLVPLLLQMEGRLAAGIAATGIAVALLSWRKPLAAWLRDRKSVV